MIKSFRFTVWNNSISNIQLYAIGVFALISIASFLAINAISLFEYIKIIGACVLLIGLYSLFFTFFDRHDISALSFIGSLVVLPFLPYMRYLIYMMAVLGCAVLVRYEWKTNKNKLFPLLVLFVAILGSRIYSDFQYQNTLSTNAISLDTFFHATIAAMYSHYGVASVGLDGLIPIAYHTLSHKIVAGVSILSGFETLAVYAYIYFAMAPLLLAFVLAGFACQLNPTITFNQALLGIGLILLAIPVVPIFTWANMWDSYFVSESYLTSIVLLIASLSTLIRWVEASTANVFNLAISLMLLILASLAKGSVGVVGLCVFGLLGLTRYRKLSFWALLAIAALVIYFGLYDTAIASKGRSPIMPMHFVATSTSFPFVKNIYIKVLMFLIIHFLPIWICFAIGLRKTGHAYLKSIEFQILLALLIPALLISLTFNIAGGSAYYFSSIPVIVSLPILVSNFSPYLNVIKLRYIFGATLLSSLLLHTAISNRSFMAQLQNNDVSILGLGAIIKQLHEIRDHLPTNVFIRIDNPERLVSKIGCKAFWFMPALMERPLIDGLPNKSNCPDFSYLDGYYGLSEYGKKKPNMDGIKIIQIRLD